MTVWPTRACEHVFVHEYGFTITEHDPDRAWIILSREHQVAELEDGLEFFAWAAERWPRDRFSVELEPWQLSPERN